MPTFANPYLGAAPDKLTKAELVQSIRLDIAGELEAIFLYEAHAMATDDEVVRKVLCDIRDEEKEHIGELLALMEYLQPGTASFLGEGGEEVRGMMEALGIEKRIIKSTDIIKITNND